MLIRGRVQGYETPFVRDLARIIAVLLIVLGVHLFLFRMMMSVSLDNFEVRKGVISIELVRLPKLTKSIAPADTPSEYNKTPAPSPYKARPQPTPKTASQAARPVILTPKTPDDLTSFREATTGDARNTAPAFEIGTDAQPAPSEGSTHQARINEGLQALSADLTCLKSFSTECAEIRKDVFSEYQMTETDKVYTKKYAHTGMPVEFYGMSERQIRAKLNVPNAGENGIVIIPGLLALDGNWWDTMHGVNKKCKWKVAAPAKSDIFARSGELSSAGRHGAVKDCPDYLPAAKDDRDRRHK